jgi:hypothetical protein
VFPIHVQYVVLPRDRIVVVVLGVVALNVDVLIIVAVVNLCVVVSKSSNSWRGPGTGTA